MSITNLLRVGHTFRSLIELVPETGLEPVRAVRPTGRAGIEPAARSFRVPPKTYLRTLNTTNRQIQVNGVSWAPARVESVLERDGIESRNHFSAQLL